MDAPLPQHGGRGAGMASGRNKQVELWWVRPRKGGARAGSPRGRGRWAGPPKGVCLARMYEIEWKEIALQLRLVGEASGDGAAGDGEGQETGVGLVEAGKGATDPRAPPQLLVVSEGTGEEGGDESIRKAAEAQRAREHQVGWDGALKPRAPPNPSSAPSPTHLIQRSPRSCSNTCTRTSLSG